MIEAHSDRLKLGANAEAVEFFSKAAPLHTPEWDAWAKRSQTPSANAAIAGRWLVTASMPGRGKYVGEMRVEAAGEEEFATRVRLTSVRDGSMVSRAGRSVVYGASAWRGRSKGADGNGGPDDSASEAREVMWLAPDQSHGEGRWYWGQYSEFGFEVQLRRPATTPTLLALDVASLKVGSQGARVRLLGDQFPARVTAADVNFGPGVVVKRVISNTASEIVAEVDVAADAALGRRDVVMAGAKLANALAIYDRVDYIKIVPESSLAAFGDATRPRGYQQFDVVGFQRGPDGKLHTADDVPLGEIRTGLTWSLEVFYTAPDAKTDFVGEISPAGFFTPAEKNANANFDVWVVAKLAGEKPLTAKSYLVVTVPSYTLNGHRYVRDLDRWVDDGPAR